MLGKKLLHLLVAGRFQAMGQVVVREIRFERVVAQGVVITPVGAAVTLGQGLLGLVVILALLTETGGGRIQDEG